MDKLANIINHVVKRIEDIMNTIENTESSRDYASNYGSASTEKQRMP